jgi:hypothetical protein
VGEQYKVDGFRFDIMGFHLKSNMLKVRAALDALTPQKDGVDGKSIYLYGEAWNFGVMANNGRGVNAIQVNMAAPASARSTTASATPCAAAVPFSPRRGPGFATGLYTEPNGTFGGSAGDEKAELLRLTDRVKLGLAGNIASYEIVDATGATSPAARWTTSACPAPTACSRRHHSIHRCARRSRLVRRCESQVELARATRRPRAHGATRHGCGRAVAGVALLHGRRRHPSLQVR